MSINSFTAKNTLTVGGTDYEVFRVDTVPGYEKLPFSLKVLLENLLRTEDGANVTKAQIEALGSWDPDGRARHRDPVHARPASSCRTSPACPASSTSPPCARRSARSAATPTRSTRSLPPSWSSTTRSSPTCSAPTNALERNVEIEYERNGERYQFLRWGQTAFDDFKVVPPGTGIVHQVNIEYLARVTFTRDGRRRPARLPRHPGRHRLAHHDGQRPRRARLGRRRHRGRGGHARPARVDAHPEGRRLQAHRLDPHRRHRDGCRAHHHRRCCASTASSASSSSSTERASPRCRSRTAPPSAT